MNGRARSTSAGSIAGNGCTRSSRNEPSNSSRTKLGACHSFSRAASATSRASCSVASGWRAAGRGAGARQSWLLASARVGARGQAGDPVQDQAHYVALASLEVLGALELDTDGRRDRPRVNQGKPAQRDDAEEQLGGIARLRVVEAELGADGGERLLPGGEVARRLRGARRRSTLRARSGGRSWAAPPGSRSSRTPRRRESPRRSGCWRAPARGRRAPPRAPRRMRDRGPRDRGRTCCRRSSPGSRGSRPPRRRPP